MQLRLSHIKGHITDSMLNEAYPDKGRSFVRLEDAKKYKKKHKLKYITKLVDYKPQDVVSPEDKVGTATIREGRRPFIRGYFAH